MTDDPAYERHSIAVNGLPEAAEVALSNAALESLLDAIEQQGATDLKERAQDSFGPKPLSLEAPQPNEQRRINPLPALRSDLDVSKAGAPPATAFPATSNQHEVLDGMMASLARVLVTPASPDDDEARHLVEVFNSAPGPSLASNSVDGETRRSAGLA